jgi:hypothetical protein
VVHQVWLGGEPFPLILGALRDGVELQAREAGYSYVLWSDGDLDRTFSDWRALARRCCHLSQQSNVARYLILEKLGGFYLDTDVELFRLPGELHGSWIAGTSEPISPRAVNPCCLACEPHADYPARMLAEIRSSRVDLGKHMAAGPFLAVASMGVDVNIWPRDIWHGKRGNPRAMGHHFGWGHRFASFLRRRQLPPASPFANPES